MPRKKSPPAALHWKTLGQVAEAFGVEYQTVKQWRMRSPKLPGKNGKFPVGEILRWYLDNIAARPTSNARQQLEQIKVASAAVDLEDKRVELDRKRGELVDADDVADLFARTIGEFNAHAEEIPERLRASIPRSAPAKMRNGVFRLAAQLIDELRIALADAADRWETELDDDADGE